MLNQTQNSKPAETAEDNAVELAIQTVEAKIRRWEETLEKGLLHSMNVLIESNSFAGNVGIF